MSEKIVTLAELLKGKKIDPKTARRKLRASEATPKPVKDSRWEWKASQAKTVLKVLAA